jgi:LacI family transcriptional regulator
VSRKQGRSGPARAGRPRGAVRLKDIAQDLGLSPMAVSKALRGHQDISAETRARVERRAARLGYRVDLVARSLRAGRTFLVGLVVPDLKQSFFSEIAMAVEAALGPAGYHVVIAHTGEDAREEAANIELLVSRKVDGLIIASAQHRGGRLPAIRTPYVLIDRTVSGVEANFVGNRHSEIGRLATGHLIEQGCRSIAYLAGPGVSSSVGRRRGYEQALARHGLGPNRSLVVEAGYDDAAGYRAMRALQESRGDVDGVFCFNDPVAVGAMRAIQETGRSVPTDIAVIGVANMHYADMFAVPLSTVDQDTARLGRQAAERLLTCMGSTRALPAETLFIPPKLIVRASSQRRAAAP